MIFVRFLLLGILLLPIVYINAQEATIEPQIQAPVSTIESSITCKKKEDTRNIEVQKVGKGCEVNYTKTTGTGSIASSKNSTHHCKTIQARVKSNLINAGYNCKNQTLK